MELKGLEQRRREIVDDPVVNYWLKQAVTELWKLDVVDALHRLGRIAGTIGRKTPRIYIPNSLW